MIRTLDFAALTASVDPVELRTWVEKRRSHTEIAAGSAGFRMFLSTLIGLILVAAMAALVVIAFLLIDDPDSLVWTPTTATAIVVALMVILAIIFGCSTALISVWRGRGQYAQWFRLSRFAAANDMDFSRVDEGAPYPGSIFEGALKILLIDHLSTHDAPVIDYGTVSRITRTGRATSSDESAYIALELGVSLPHMVLDAQRNSETNVVLMARDQALSLEGDFDDHFTLYAPVGYERDALYIFTPDLMALLIDEASAFDVEIIDRWMLFHSSTLFDLQLPSTHERVFRIADLVGAKALRQTVRYSDGRSDTRLAIAPQGRRLRRRISLPGAAIALVIVLLPFLPLIVRGITGS